MKIAGIIPSRYASTRFPGKPLALIGNKTMIQRVYEQAVKAASLEQVFVATDDSRIEKAVMDFGGKVVMTSEKHKSGTDRCMEAIEKIEQSGSTFDVIVNIQGDEPFIEPNSIETLTAGFQNPEVQIATLAKKITSSSDLFNHNINKVILDKHKNAIYFSRHPIPFIKNHEPETWISKFDFYKHIGIYAYRASTLQKITGIEMSSLEIAESLEQLRWIENGYKIHVDLTDYDSIAIDTPDDLLKFLNNR
jgi:3-deoxy-manno-octulosonate cytidylyltransferase (CMP-KDO synthetase)